MCASQVARDLTHALLPTCPPAAAVLARQPPHLPAVRFMNFEGQPEAGDLTNRFEQVRCTVQHMSRRSLCLSAVPAGRPDRLTLNYSLIAAPWKREALHSTMGGFYHMHARPSP